MTSACFDERHFIEIDGALRPAPWMQWRHVASVGAKGKSVSYGVTGGGNKDELLQSLKTGWVNDSPIDQQVYGLITRGGQRVTLQARSRGGLVLRSGYRRVATLINDSFETTDPRWTFASAHVIQEAAASFDGQRRLQLNAVASGEPGSWFAKTIPVSPGDKVRVRFRARRDAAVTGGPGYLPRVRLGKQNGDFWQGVTFLPNTMAATGTWYTYTALFTVPADGSITGVNASIQTGHTSGTLWLDSLVITASAEGDPELPLVLNDSSIFGVGGDVGRGGLLAIGTSFAIPEVRMNSGTIPLAPERTGWAVVHPDERFDAAAELRFITQLWEYTTIDGGDSESESGFATGDTRLDLYAVPVIT